ncbi:MAG: hypothetical protein SF172_11045 [Burkholderiales bacterium]|nr:hypothetical protein [Burkholderiales bacterium]
MKNNTRADLERAFERMQRAMRKRGTLGVLTVVDLARESGVSRSLIYRDHGDLVERLSLLKREKSKAKVDAERHLIAKLRAKCARQSETIKSLATGCAELLNLLELEKRRSKRLAERIQRISQLPPNLGQVQS